MSEAWWLLVLHLVAGGHHHPILGLHVLHVLPTHPVLVRSRVVSQCRLQFPASRLVRHHPWTQQPDISCKEALQWRTDLRRGWWQLMSWFRGQYLAYTVLFSQVAGLAGQGDLNYKRKLVIL